MGLSQRSIFRPRARLIRTIGDRLISGPVAAIGELVKNGFDADAKKVVVRFVSDESSVKKIEVEDSGHGMLLETISDKWMEPATEVKQQTRNSKGGRKVLGSKGIGRFAASRLGSRMLLVSTAMRNEKLETTVVRVNWSKFDEDQYLDEVTVTSRVLRKSRKEAGTLIRMTGVPNEWHEHQFNDLLKELRKFTSPLAKPSETKRFSIYLDITECSPNFIGQELWRMANEPQTGSHLIEIKPIPIFDAADYEVTGTFEESGLFKGIMKFNGISKHAPEEIIFTKLLDPNLGQAPCGKVTIKMMIFDRDPQSIDALIGRANLKGIGKREARKLLDDLCGVGIYRFGFRIRPYGDSDQDWLELDRRRVDDPSNKIGHNQVVGIVHVEDEAVSNLIERSSREGLEDNGSLSRLKSLLLTLFARQVEPLRRAARVHAGIGVKKPTSYSKVYESADFKWTEDILRSLSPSKRKKARELIEKQSRQLKTQLNDLQQRQARLEANFTLGQIVAEVIHTGRQPASAIGMHIADVLEDWPIIISDDKNAPKIAEEARESLVFSLKESHRLERLFKLLSPLSGRRRGRPVSIQISPVLHGVKELYQERIDSNNIEVNITADENLYFTGYRDDLAISVANLIENSIYWLKESGTKGPFISISSGSDQSDFWVDIEDNGPGISPRIEEQLFEPGFTTRIEGTGLGLSISREALARSSAQISFVHVDNGSKFRIYFSHKEHKK